MAKCRNCKKEIDANATRCPYCLTELPTSKLMANLKSTLITLGILGIFAVAMYYFIINILVENINHLVSRNMKTASNTFESFI